MQRKVFKELRSTVQEKGKYGGRGQVIRAGEVKVQNSRGKGKLLYQTSTKEYGFKLE